MKRKLGLIYKKLFTCFGPQHWWPADSPFEVIVGAILTQGTNWNNVEKAINNLKRENLLIPRKLDGISQQRLASLIRPCGYFNIKAKRLKSFLSVLFDSYNGSLKNMFYLATPRLREALLDIKGIGPETADSILLYAAQRPVFVVDAYTKRILLRQRLISENSSYHEIQDLFMRDLKENVSFFNEYHALLVKLGKETCAKSNPKCSLCPIRGGCNKNG